MAIKKNIVPGTQYQFDLNDLAVVGKNSTGITLCYKQGLEIQIDIDKPEDRERQYREICDLHSGKVDASTLWPEGTEFI